MPVINSIASWQAEMTAWRHDFHRHPELGFKEVRTSDIVAEKLASWGIEVHRGIAGTGVVGVLRGQSDADKRIGLRADMDALPMTEETGLPYQSANPGVFHGCGHDGHMTMLLGAARYLAETRAFAGTVHFIFQPAEEGGGGGEVMVREGLFDRFDCDEVYAVHNWPELPTGEIGVRAGPMMAATDTFDITLSGVGGHAAMPHLARDPVVIGAHLVTALQTLVSRQTDPLDNAVLSVTRIEAGSAYNVIPGEAKLFGTVRTFREDTRQRIADDMRRLVDGFAQAFHVAVALKYDRGYPPTVNHERESDLAAAAAERVVGADRVRRDILPVMGGEDFAYMLNARPGAYLWVGQGGGPTACSVHNPRYDFNDEILPIGASFFATLVEQRLPPAS